MLKKRENNVSEERLTLFAQSIERDSSPGHLRPRFEGENESFGLTSATSVGHGRAEPENPLGSHDWRTINGSNRSTESIFRLRH